MKKYFSKLAAGFLALAMVLGMTLAHLPSLDVLAAPVTMAHLKAGSGNGNGHFGSSNPEAFVLSDGNYTGGAVQLSHQAGKREKRDEAQDCYEICG